MDTKTFLKTLLPESGIKFVASIRPRKNPQPGKATATIHYPVADYDEAADKAILIDRTEANDNVYFAMASFKEVIYKTTAYKDKDGNPREFEYPAGRVQTNVRAVKCLWMDLDVGKAAEANSYATRQDALASLKTYIDAVGLPTPIIVNSGYGLHAYWSFTEEVSADEWESTAKYQRVIMRHLGVKFDPSRDKDCASVLRVPGTYNKKPGKEPKLVKVVRGIVDRMPAQEYKRLLKKYVADNGLDSQVAPDVPEWARGLVGNLSGPDMEFPDSYAAIAVTHCKQMQEFRDTGGASEPIWYAHIGLMKHFKDGVKLAHEWSAKYAGYSAEETDAKLEQWTYGPTTCEKFKELNAEGCAGCEKTCKSPVQLGLTEEVTKPNITEMIEQAAAAATEVLNSLPSDETVGDDGAPVFWPEGFSYTPSTELITRRIKDKDGVWQDSPVATPLFYPVDQICQEDGTFALRMHIWIRGKAREFLLPTKHTADPRNLKIHLAANRVHVMDDKGAALCLSKQMVAMTKRREEINTYKQMGWHHDYQAFLIGDTLITKDSERKVVLGQRFPNDLRNCYKPKGNKQLWIDAVNELYNREYAEPYQFAICAAFSSVLNPLLGYSEWSGIPYAFTTSRSGYGKSTVNKIALSIWMQQTRDTVVCDATPKAVLGMASAMNNVPFLLDEVTKYMSDPADQADILYAFSNGTPRKGMTQDGALREASPGWNGNYPLTGNRNIMQQVTENKLNPEAAQMRLFEIDLDTYPRVATMSKGTPEYDALYETHSHLARTVVDECYGTIGVDFVRYIMAHQDDVREKLKRVSRGLAKHMNGGDATKERFYYHLITCVLVAGYYAKKMGLVSFDLARLRDWCIEHVRRLRLIVNEFQNTPEDNFANMMSDLVGKIVVTRNFAKLDGRSGYTETHIGRNLRNPICGRFVIGDEKERPQLYLTIRAVQQWCFEHGIQYTTLRREFIEREIIRFGAKGVNRDTGAARISIGRGVDDLPNLGKPWCLELDAERAAGIVTHALPADILPIQRKKHEEQGAA